MPFRVLSLLLGSMLSLTSCDIDYASDTDYYYDFRQGSQQWQAGFSDYSSDNADIYQLDSGLRPLPTGFSGTGYYLQGMNRSDDLFMYLKRQISGLQPTTSYQLAVSVRLRTDAGANCVGVGGAAKSAAAGETGGCHHHTGTHSALRSNSRRHHHRRSVSAPAWCPFRACIIAARQC